MRRGCSPRPLRDLHARARRDLDERTRISHRELGTVPLILWHSLDTFDSRQKNVDRRTHNRSLTNGHDHTCCGIIRRFTIFSLSLSLSLSLCL
jgi:hypothetical protein